MQERPNKLVLLSAIARFLVEEARPALTDPRLNFRALIAAHLAHVVSTELASDDQSVTHDLDRLRSFFPDAPPPNESLAAKQALVADLNARLAARLRDDGALAPADLTAIASALRESLREKLAIENPHFDTALDVE
jgi:uncharacterized protein DUF6285